MTNRAAHLNTSTRPGVLVWLAVTTIMSTINAVVWHIGDRPDAVESYRVLLETARAEMWGVAFAAIAALCLVGLFTERHIPIRAAMALHFFVCGSFAWSLLFSVAIGRTSILVLAGFTAWTSWALTTAFLLAQPFTDIEA